MAFEIKYEINDGLVENQLSFSKFLTNTCYVLLYETCHLKSVKFVYDCKIFKYYLFCNINKTNSTNLINKGDR